MVVVNGENSRLQNGVFATWVSEGVLMTLYASSFTAATAVLAMSSTYSMINDFNSRFSSLSGYVEKLLFHFHSKTQKKSKKRGMLLFLVILHILNCFTFHFVPK